VVRCIAVVCQNVPIRQAVVVALSKLLLVCIDLVQLASHLSVPSTKLTAENVSTLGGGTRLSLDGPWAVSMDFCNHLHLIWIVHHEFLGISSVGVVGSLTARNNFALRSHSWNFVVVFVWHIGHVLLNRPQHTHIVVLIPHTRLVFHEVS
jgi:hypothetical protein